MTHCEIIMIYNPVIKATHLKFIEMRMRFIIIYGNM